MNKLSKWLSLRSFECIFRYLKGIIIFIEEEIKVKRMLLSCLRI